MTHASHAASNRALAWEEWSPSAFERAARERRMILVSVQADWCHWCHVMNATTFRDLDVVALLSNDFILIRVEADARPDIAERYFAWGWPATIILTPDAQPLREMRGYRETSDFLAVTRSLVSDLHEGRPLAHRDAGAPTNFAIRDLNETRVAVRRALDAFYDEEDGGWGDEQKYPNAAPVEYAFFRSAIHDEIEWQERALFTANQYARLLDPVWGGMYQYSVPRDWEHPHFEKIASVQAGAIDIFAEAARATHDAAWIARAREVSRYVLAMWRTDEGVFYASQDADVRGDDGTTVSGHDYYALAAAQRMAIGTPRFDRHIYANTNGMLIAALAHLYEATLDESLLDAARTAAQRIMQTHGRNGAFAHDAASADSLFYLDDQVQMIRAFDALYNASGEEMWSEASSSTLSFVRERLRDANGGFFAHTEDPHAAGIFAQRRKPFVANALLARILIRRSWVSGEEELHTDAANALRVLSAETTIAAQGRDLGEYLLALEELEAEHLIFTIVGPRDRPQSEMLRHAAVTFYYPARVVESAEPGRGRYPYPGEPALFLCSGESCSMPITLPTEVHEAARAFLASVR